MTTVLPTWSGRSQFRYGGCVTSGTEIQYGDKFRFKIKVGAGSYLALLKTFAGQEVPIGTSRTALPANSVGAWLKANVSQTALASYVGPILIQEGYAKRGRESDLIQFNPGTRTIRV